MLERVYLDSGEKVKQVMLVQEVATECQVFLESFPKPNRRQPTSCCPVSVVWGAEERWRDHLVWGRLESYKTVHLSHQEGGEHRR